jgi:hypothetical protein
MPQILRVQEKSLTYPTDMRLGRLHGQSGPCSEEENLLRLLEIESQFLGHPGHDIDALLNEISHLPNPVISLNPMPDKSQDISPILNRVFFHISDSSQTDV